MRLRILLTGAHLLLIAAVPPVRGDGNYEIRQVADGVYAALQPSARRFNESNSAIVVTDRDVIVVDSQSSLALVRELIAEIRKLTDKPVCYLVNTHFHSDHTQGNEIYREAFPGVEIIGHSRRGAISIDVVSGWVPALIHDDSADGHRLSSLLESFLYGVEASSLASSAVAVTVLVAVAVTVLDAAAVLASAVPAWRASRVDPARTLRAE